MTFREFLLSVSLAVGPLPLAGDSAELALPNFVEAISKHRHFARKIDPPRV